MYYSVPVCDKYSNTLIYSILIIGCVDGFLALDNQKSSTVIKKISHYYHSISTFLSDFFSQQYY